MIHTANGVPVIGLGEVLWDCFVDSRRPGGAPANVAFQAQQLGCRGVVCSRVGNDRLGDELCEFLHNHRLDTSYIQRDIQYPTGSVTVDVSNSGHPKFTIHQNVAWDKIEFNEGFESIARQASAVCFGTLAQRSPKSRNAIHRFLAATQNSSLIVYDVNLRQQWYQRAWIEHSLKAANIVKLNEEEAPIIARELQIESDPTSHRALAHAFNTRFDVAITCITRGDRGCLLYAADEEAVGSGIPVEVGDTVGAGDAFTAALTFAQLNRWSLPSSAEFANRVGALVASKKGAMPALSEEFSDLIAAFRARQADNQRPADGLQHD